MPVLGITGSIATGKSTFSRAISSRLPAEIFDADAFARALLENDAKIRSAVSDSIGVDAFFPDGRPNRPRLREMIFADPTTRARLNAILHPRVRDQWVGLGEAVRAKGGWLLVDIPLLYETQAEVHLDRVIVVGCSPKTQLNRLLKERALPLETAERIIAAQLDLPTKIKRADHVIWNDFSLAALEAQADLLTSWLTQHYG